MTARTASLCFLAAMISAALHAAEPVPANPLIDYPGFQKVVEESGPEREVRRSSEDVFWEMMWRPGVVVLDARTDLDYRQPLIAGAVNLPFTEFTAASLAAVIPSRDTPILICCYHNSAFTSLRAYGYTRIYELGPLLKVAESRLPFVGERVVVTASGRLERKPVDMRDATRPFDPGVVAKRALAGAPGAVSPAGATASPER